jgi:hypothetical protein
MAGSEDTKLSPAGSVSDTTPPTSGTGPVLVTLRLNGTCSPGTTTAPGSVDLLIETPAGRSLLVTVQVMFSPRARVRSRVARGRLPQTQSPVT